MLIWCYTTFTLRGLLLSSSCCYGNEIASVFHSMTCIAIREYLFCSKKSDINRKHTSPTIFIVEGSKTPTLCVARFLYAQNTATHTFLLISRKTIDFKPSSINNLTSFTWISNGYCQLRLIQTEFSCQCDEVDRFMANKVICKIYKDNVSFDRDVTDSSISKLSNGINIGLLIKTRYVKTIDTMLSLIQRAVNYSQAGHIDST